MRMTQKVEEAPRNWKATQSGNGNKVVTLTKGETLYKGPAEDHRNEPEAEMPRGDGKAGRLLGAPRFLGHDQIWSCFCFLGL